MVSVENSLLTLLETLYPKASAKRAHIKMLSLANTTNKGKGIYKPSQTDTALISYADSVVSKKTGSLLALNSFLVENKVYESVNSLHILPFYPWDTDRGFSVKSYYNVDPAYGTWADIKKLSKTTRLMFDFVANHTSIDNPIVQASLIHRHADKNGSLYRSTKKYKNFVIAYSDSDKPSPKDLKKLARPRPSPVLTPYTVLKVSGKIKAVLGTFVRSGVKGKEVVLGSGWVWTTFSRPQNPNGSQATKQVDLNFKNPEVLIEAIKILIFYIKRGARLIRLDAIGYLWKKIGSSSLHEKETHVILKIIYKVIKAAYPDILLVSEINEEQDKVLKYLGTQKYPETDLVYQFTHFPLAIFSLLTGDTKAYKNWIKTTDKFRGKQFITVLGSHDGLGLKPLRGILTPVQIGHLNKILIDRHKALPNYAVLPGGKRIVYEICATPWNLINPPGSKELLDNQINRYLAVLCLGLCVKGVAGVYLNGLIGSENYRPKNGLDENRTINRERFELSKLSRSLQDKNSQAHLTFQKVKKVLSIKSGEDVFNPNAPTPSVLEVSNKSVVALKLKDIGGKNTLFSIINLSKNKQTVLFQNDWKNVVFNSHGGIVKTKKSTLNLQPYQILWLR